MKKICILGGVAILATLAMFSGCATPSSQDEAATSAQVSDRDLTSEINDRLRLDTITARYVFSVSVEDGIVTLSGHVDDASVRMRAVGVVRSTPGVLGVIDNTKSF